jgi:alpha-1,6-mannosyltransferase
VLVASRHLAAELTAHGVERVVQVPLGVDLEHFHPRRRERREATRARLGLQGGPLALFAGRYAREKGLDVVLDAWPEIERRTGMRLVLIGDGPLEQSFRTHSYASRVHWLPFERDREKFADLLAAADLYLAPGPYETFGLSDLEAMACGTPVLTVDRGGVAERVEDSGAGASYPFGDSAGLVVCAARLSAQDLPALGRKGREFAERHHGWDHALEQLTSAYRRILAQ